MRIQPDQGRPSGAGRRHAARVVLVAVLAALVLPLYAVGEALLTHPSHDLQDAWLVLVVVGLLAVAAIVSTSRHLRARLRDESDPETPVRTRTEELTRA